MMALNHIEQGEVFAWRKKQLAKGGTSENLDWLLDFAAGISWSDLQKNHIDSRFFIYPTQSLDQVELMWNEHIEGNVPLQYLVGRCSWRNFELEITPAALIPRPETELLIDFALERVDAGNTGYWTDLGTGSGAIAIALGRALPKWQGHAVDLSNDALELARRNLQKLSPASATKCLLHCGSWWEPLKPWWGLFSLAVVNPPYIPSGLMSELDPVVRENEPHLALFGGEDGLQATKEVIDGANNALSKGGLLCIEHHHDQSDFVLELMVEAGLDNVEFEKDLEGVRRFAIARRPCLN